MSLGHLIQALAAEDPSKVLRTGITNPHSYRGDYFDLAFEPVENVTVADSLAAAQSALGETFEGWKGGTFRMDEHTTCHLAFEGSCGEELGPLHIALMLSAEHLPAPALTADRVKELEDAEATLTALRDAGVDNWGGYDEAMDALKSGA